MILGVSVRLFFGAEVNIEISKAVLSLMWVQLEARVEQTWASPSKKEAGLQMALN